MPGKCIKCIILGVGNTVVNTVPTLMLTIAGREIIST